MKTSLALLLRHSNVQPRRKTRRNSGCADRADLSERLPLELIVERLPLRQRVQILCVCKAWNHRLRDSVAAELEEILKGPPWLLMGGYFRGAGWQLMAFRITGSLVTQVCLMPSGLGGVNGSLTGCNNLFDDFHLPRMAGSGGLMCCLLSANSRHVVAVFNCVTGFLKILPSPLCSDLLFSRRDLYNYDCYDPCPCHIYMAVDDSDPKRYYIMLTRVSEYCDEDFSRADRHMEVFDSKVGVWKDASIPFESDRIDGYIPSHVWDGNFFFIYEDTSQGPTTMYLTAYHVESDVWSMQEVQIYRNLLEHECYRVFIIHKFEGRLFFATELEDGFGFRIWEVRQTTSRAAMWVEIACTPLHISKDIKISYGVKLLACGSCFFLIVYKDGFSMHGSPPLVYNMANNSWYFLPVKEWLSGYSGVLVHQPSLSARI